MARKRAGKRQARGSNARDERRKWHGKSVKKAVFYGFGVLILTLVTLKALEVFFPGLTHVAEEFVIAYGLLGTFVFVFLGSTILPFPTDAFFLSVAKLYSSPLELLVVASLASLLGSIVNYYLAYYFSNLLVPRFVSKDEVGDGKVLMDKYGPIAILVFAAIPASILADPLTVVCGLTHMDVKRFIGYSLVAKFVHFALILAFATYF